MKKVLFISFYHTSRPGGSFRPFPLTKYLLEFGWEPVILTPELTVKIDTPLRIIGTPYRDALGLWKKALGFQRDKPVRSQLKNKLGITSSKSTTDKLLTFLEGLAGYPDFYRGWKPFALKAGEQLLRKEKMDAVISCAPMTSHIIAAKLVKKYKIPWLADFPDLWSQNHGYAYFWLRKRLDTRLEKNTLKVARALVTISEPWAEKLRKLHPDKNVYMIPHGYDPDLFDTPAPPLTVKFTLTYTGIVYHQWQHVSGFFGALRELITEKTINPDDIEVRFYGSHDPFLQDEIVRFNLESIARQYGKVPQNEAVTRQRESQVLLLLGWNDPQEKGVYTSKIFEYLGARRPVLVCGGGTDVVTELLDKTRAGVYAFSQSEIKIALHNLYRDYKVSQRVGYNGIEAEVSRYSHREMARKFAEILNGITG